MNPKVILLVDDIRKPVDLDQFVDAIEQLGLYWLVINEPPPKGGTP